MYYEKSENQTLIDRGQLQMVCLEDLVPEDHLLRRIDKYIDFSFIHDLTRRYYCPNNGRACLDTVTLFKIPILNFLMNKNSIRATLEETNVNMAYRWFLNIGLTEKVPNFSTFSQNYKRRYEGTDIFEKIFTYFLTQAIEKGLVDASVIFVDGTHIKANANKHKSIRQNSRIFADKYHKELEKEIDEYRELNGRDKFHDDNDSNYKVDDETGEIIEEKDTKYKTETISTTDPDSGMFVKGEHERQFAYVDQVACDKHGWILAYSVNKGSMHDSKAFLPFFENSLLPYNPKTICADAGYISALICENVQKNNINILLPYAISKGGRSDFDKKNFDYYIESDSYLCVNKKNLEPWNITKDGYIEYKIHKDECENCKYKGECIKNYAFKTIRRHLYQDCLEKAKAYRLSDEGKEIYKLRKETIERIFAEGKEKHSLRFTRYKGRQRNFDMRALLYSCLNIKKLTNFITKLVSKYDMKESY